MTLENASAVDLDWFWRGWFFGTDNVDVSVEEVKWFKLRNEQTDPEKKIVNVKGGDLTAQKSDATPATDFSKGPQPFSITNTSDQLYGEFQNRLDDNAVRKKLAGKNIYEVKFKNNGGLVTPLVIEWTFKDGSKEIERIPAEIWRLNETEITKVFVKDKEVVNVLLDPNLELADVDVANNTFPKKIVESKFDQLKKN